MKYCALCCTACDEDLYLGEWLAYHALIGFEHFIVYDDCSAVPISDLLGGRVRPDQVTVVRHSAKRDQITTYTRCLEDFGPQFKWIAFLDVDEFIRLGPVRRSPGQSGDAAGRGLKAFYSDIRIFLSAYEPYAALGLNWRMFSSSGHETRPSEPVIAAYTGCLGDDIHIKSLVQPARITSVATPHSFHTRPGSRAVNPARFTIPSGFSLSVADTGVAAVNHYFFKSRECFAAKVERGNPCNIQRRMDEFEKHLARPVTPDFSLLPYGPPVAEALASGRMPEAERLAFLSPGELDGRPGDGLGNARVYLARAEKSGGGKRLSFLRQALLHLARVSLCNDADHKPDPLIGLEVWTLRAEAAMLDGVDDLALVFLDRAMECGAGKEAYATLARLLLGKGKKEASRQALDILGAHGARR